MNNATISLLAHHRNMSGVVIKKTNVTSSKIASLPPFFYEFSNISGYFQGYEILPLDLYLISLCIQG